MNQPDHLKISYSPAQRALWEKRLRRDAYGHFARRVQHFLPMTGGADKMKRITIRDQKTRWGSCYETGTISFNWRLMLAPPEVLDYVVVHELCHLTHMNHSKEFWAKVAEVDPEYKEHIAYLKQNEDNLRLQ